MDESPHTPRGWLVALADDAGVEWFAAAGASPWLGRYGIAPRDDDGIVAARVAIDGQPFLVAVQDASFLGGSVGERHGRHLAALLASARATRTAVVLLLASGGVRLHEANPAEVALAAALRELVATRAAGVPVLGIAIGDVFGGASVLACATTRLAMVPGARLGLSGPKVIAQARGRSEIDPDDAAGLGALFGTEARAAAGAVDLLEPRAPSLRAWCIHHAAAALPLADAVAAMQRPLAAALPLACAPRLAVDADGRVDVPAVGGAVDATALCALDAALLALPPAARTVVLHEDSAGHDVSRAAEAMLLSRYLAHHATVLGLLRAKGLRLAGVVDGTGHSAAFFANALQADELYVAPTARVVAMEPAALARVIGVPAATVEARTADDPLLGHAAQHLVTLGAAHALPASGLP
ncbi:MAG: hypothetical protein JSR18_14760 [Proteobacteria bacterium]|nr:hypothetical protein [Pseudomonadota bacterium]